MLHSLDYYLCSLSSLLRNRTIGSRKVPAYVVFLSLCAATGGLMFGYDIGISGGVTVMDDFLCQFFPGVLEEKIRSQGSVSINIMKCKQITTTSWDNANKEFNAKYHTNLLYCLFGDQKVQLFTSSLYFAAMVATIFAAYVSRQRGRKITIMLASIFYFVGVVLNIVSGILHNKNQAAFYLLILGRIMLGIGVGFGNQAIPLFISEIAPAHARGSLNYLFQLNVTIGIFFANIVNWKAHSLHPSGWRLSLGLAGAPAILFLVASFFLVESPSSLVQRGMYDQAQEILKILQVQGANANLTQDLGIPHHDSSREVSPIGPYTIDGASSMKSSKNPINGLFTRSNMPPLLITIFVQLFQQFSGINAVMLYAPVLFTSFGSRTNISLVFVVIIGIVNVASTIFSILVVDRIGRRRLLLVASGVLFLTQLLLGVLLVCTKHGEELENWHARVFVALICVYVGAFECSWGPLGWLISTEIFPLEWCSEGQSVTVFFNMLFTFVIAHTSLSMLCTFKYGIFFFFAAWVAIMGLCSYLFLPETRNIEIDMMIHIWSYHWFWRYFVGSPTSPHLGASMPPCNPHFPSSPHLEMSNTKVNPFHQQESARYL